MPKIAMIGAGSLILCKTLVARPEIKTPANVQGVEVPLDPALAIANRFEKLASQA